MTEQIDLKAAVQRAGGIRAVSTALAISYEAVRKWVKANRLPRTEWTGETNYRATICELANGRLEEGQRPIAPNSLLALPQKQHAA